MRDLTNKQITTAQALRIQKAMLKDQGVIQPPTAKQILGQFFTPQPAITAPSTPEETQTDVPSAHKT